MSQLRIQLFGRFCLKFDGVEIKGIEGSKAQELFAYLLIHHDHSYSREALAELLWEGCNSAQSKKNLRQALWQIHSALRHVNGLHPDDFFQADTHWMQVCLNQDVSLDVAIFDEATTKLGQWKGRDLDEAQAEALKAATELYQGDLLEGCYRDWCLLERERRQCNLLLLLDRLMGYAEAAQEYEMVLACGQRILHFDRAREQTHRRLMNLYYLAGDRTGALRQYQHCVEVLAEELSVKPSRLTLELFQQISDDNLPSHADSQRQQAREADFSVLSHILSRFEEVQTLMTELQHQVQKEIRHLMIGSKHRH